MAKRGWITDFWAQVDKSGDCWVWIRGRTKAGYGELWDGTRVIHAHRHAWALENGPIPVGMYVCHSCDNPPCVRPEHLFLGTAADNNRDMRVKGRANDVGRPPGRRVGWHPNAKLTLEQAMEIRRLYAAGGTSHRRLAAQFGITKGAITQLLTGRTWPIP